jgi:hypothetical protein
VARAAAVERGTDTLQVAHRERSSPLPTGQNADPPASGAHLGDSTVERRRKVEHPLRVARLEREEVEMEQGGLRLKGVRGRSAGGCNARRLREQRRTSEYGSIDSSSLAKWKLVFQQPRRPRNLGARARPSE